MSAAPPSESLPLEFHDVSYIRDGSSVLSGVSLKIADGTPTVLIGPNGSGKTTMLRLAMGLLTPTRGLILGAGQDVRLNHRQAFVFQRPTMLRRSAAENIRYTLRASRYSRQREAARIAQLLALVGLESCAQRSARSLSGGEQQRLALARALGREPQLLFLDEPTASLDPAATQIIEDLLRSLASSGVKIVMSTHDLGEARRLAGDIVMLHRGRVLEHAPAERFFNAPASREAAVFLSGELLL